MGAPFGNMVYPLYNNDQGAMGVPQFNSRRKEMSDDRKKKDRNGPE
jgi:hypothetical protein